MEKSFIIHSENYLRRFVKRLETDVCFDCGGLSETSMMEIDANWGVLNC